MDKPMWQQYILWMAKMFHGDFGQSFQWNQPVSTLIASRMPMTIVLSLITLIFAYALAIPIGIYSARHQYSIGDYLASIFGFIGLATPSFFFGIDFNVLQQSLFWIKRRWILFAGISECTVELGQTLGSV